MRNADQSRTAFYDLLLFIEIFEWTDLYFVLQQLLETSFILVFCQVESTDLI